MGADQQFCLRWNNFHTNITSAFESLRDDEDFVDITLACEGRQIKAHKMVLSACSPYFRSLLRGNPCQHPIVFLKDVSFAHLTSILNFMYHGEVNVSHNELATFLKTAEALRVRGLAEDEKKRDGETCTESSSPPPPRDPPEPCSPSRTEEPPGEGGGGRVSAGDTGGGGDDNTSSEGPPIKRQRRRSGNTSSHIEHDTNTSDHLMQQTDTSSTTIRESVKNEPEDYVNEDDDMLGHQQQQLANEDIKMDGYTANTSEDSVSEYMGGSDSVSITSRSQAAMQQLQDTFSTFIPGMTGQNPASFLPHSTPGGTDHGRPHPPFSLEGVQGLPPGISALPGPSMSQGGGASQDTSGQGARLLLYGGRNHSKGDAVAKQGSGVLYRRTNCPICSRSFFNKYSLKRHMIQSHKENHVHTRPYASYARTHTPFPFNATAAVAAVAGHFGVGGAWAGAGGYSGDVTTSGIQYGVNNSTDSSDGSGGGGTGGTTLLAERHRGSCGSKPSFSAASHGGGGSDGSPGTSAALPSEFTSAEDKNLSGNSQECQDEPDESVDDRLFDFQDMT